MTGRRRATFPAVAGTLLFVALVASFARAAAAAAPLVRASTAVNQPMGQRAIGRVAAAIPCHYNWNDTVLVEAPCPGECGVDRQYRVNRVAETWTPGMPRNETAVDGYTDEWLCTPTQVLAGARGAVSQPLTCLRMGLPGYAELCPHAPATPGCGWVTTPRLSVSAAAAIQAAVPRPEEEDLLGCL